MAAVCRCLLPGSGTPGSVLSAGGELHLTADTVNINTRVRAPFGLIDVVAKDLGIHDGGLLSTSADTTIPFGRLQGGFAWVYETGNVTRIFASDDKVALPQQSITLSADKVALDSGATIDFSGGGDLLAAEFQPGPGGTKDILSADVSPNLFAIVPRPRPRLRRLRSARISRLGTAARAIVFISTRRRAVCPLVTMCCCRRVTHCSKATSIPTRRSSRCATSPRRSASVQGRHVDGTG